MIAYLLHQLPETERQAFEDRLMDENVLFEQLQDTEAELLDAYAHGKLAAPDRERVEKYLLGSPSQRQKLHFAQALNRTFSPPAQSLSWRFIATAAAAIVLFATSAWLAIDNSRLRRNVPAAVAPPAPAAPVFLAELRSDSTTRSAAPALVQMQLPAPTQVVRIDLQLDAGDENQTLAASLSRDGVEIWKEEPIQPEPRDFGFAAPMWIPAAHLNPGEYLVKLTARGSLINDYRFKIVTSSRPK